MELPEIGSKPKPGALIMQINRVLKNADNHYSKKNKRTYQADMVLQKLVEARMWAMQDEAPD